MRSVRYEIDLLSGLELAARGERKHLLFVPPDVEPRESLVDLLLREQRGYREAELEVIRRRIEDLENKRKDILEHCEYERDLRTGERFPVAPELGGLQYRIEQLENEAAGHRRILSTLDAPETRRHVAALLDGFEVRPNSEWLQWQTAEGNGILVDLVTYGYGLVEDPEERLQLRRIAFDLPPDRDWE